ncbi:hypothetical protein [Geminicoccus roseus]|uniref:hypothetical protein n=1 Tax=Geminicoccus roseus TaxID=404900 RepID=UPI0004116414|nr:hypothetical protein [Geminicoccus roseus]
MDAGTLHVVVDDRHVGLLLKTGSAFRFVAADPAYRLLDGSRFVRLEQVQHAAHAMKHALAENRLPTRRTGPRHAG